MNTCLADLWKLLGGDPAALSSLRLTGERVFPSRFDVTGFARDAVALASLAVADLHAARRGEPPAAVSVDSLGAAAAFRSEALLAPIGWSLPPVWDPIAGDYRARDRWIRLHTNYAYHRAATQAALGLRPEANRDEVAAAVASWDAVALETAVVSAGGCAAAMLTRSEWLSTPHGQATAAEPAVALAPLPGAARPLPTSTIAPLAGVRVLDLTRVIAGPVCTRFLAAYGASVLRLDPPGFQEVPAVVPEMTTGKRCAVLGLDTDAGRERFLTLLDEADVLVHGLRPGALARLGLTDELLRARNPSLITAALDAYGWQGPWSGRRGFDSLVQMSVGIAAPTQGDRPTPLPAQALDHGAGYLLAAAVARALALRARHGHPAAVRASLLGTANHLIARGEVAAEWSAPAWPATVLEEATTAWGPVRRVRCPGQIEGTPACWRHDAAPLGSADASWEPLTA